MHAALLDGAAIAKTIRKHLKARVSAMGQAPGLAVILVGDDPASETYVRVKQKAAEEIGIRFSLLRFEATTNESVLEIAIQELNQDPQWDGVLVQLPLPTQNADRLLPLINPRKDVDGFHEANLQALESGTPGLVSPVALGIMKLLASTERPLEGKTAVLVGSERFARPLRALLHERKAILERVDPDLPLEMLREKTAAAPILISAVGRPGFIAGDRIQRDAVVIDVGTTRVGDALLGDVDQSSASAVAGFLTPIPGGVGPMTVAMLMLNVCKARELGIGNA